MNENNKNSSLTNNEEQQKPKQNKEKQATPKSNKEKQNKAKNSKAKKPTQKELDARKNKIIMIVSICVVALIILATVLAIVLTDKKGDGPEEPMGTGACEYLETRDISGRDIKYVEMCVEGYGRLVILLDATTAPETVANFLSLVESGFYDGLTFHRIIQDFMVQGGDPKANGTGGNTDASGKEINIKGEFDSNGHPNDISHKYGVISMARSDDPNSASSQFFICNADASDSLDKNYAAFGYVVEGMSVIDAITKDVFPKTDYYNYYEQFMLTGDQAYYYYWNVLGNGALSNKEDQPVIKYIKVLDSWEK